VLVLYTGYRGDCRYTKRHYSERCYSEHRYSEYHDFCSMLRFQVPTEICYCIWGFHKNILYTLCSKKSDAKIKITITMVHLIRINYPLSSFNYRLSGTNVANFNKIHHMVSEQQIFLKRNLKTKFSNMENTN